MGIEPIAKIPFPFPVPVPVRVPCSMNSSEQYLETHFYGPVPGPGSVQCERAIRPTYPYILNALLL